MTATMLKMNFMRNGGVFGVYDFDGNDVSSTIYYGLFAFSTEDRKAAVSQSARQMVLREK